MWSCSLMLIQAICHSEAKTQTFTSRKTILKPREGQKKMCFVIHGHHQSILHIAVLKNKKQKLCGLILVEYSETVLSKVQFLSMLKKTL